MSLPFSLTTDSLADWLDGLASLPPANAANQLNHTLKELRNTKATAKELLPIWVNLTPPCMYLSNSLSALSLGEADHKLTSKSIKVAKLAIQLLRQLSLGFCSLAETRQLDRAQNQLAIFYALQLIGYCLRSYHLLYEMPSTSLWKKSASLYRLADETGCLEQQQAPKLQEFKSQTTIAAVLKRNILFCLFTPTHYRAPEIDQLFQLANQHYNLLDILTKDGREFHFYWNLEGDEPCAIKRVSKHLPEGFLAIDCDRFVKTLQQRTLETKLKPTTQARLALQLSGYEQIFNDIQIGSASAYHLLISFETVCHYFQEQDKLSKILHVSTGGKPMVRRMGLVPLESEKSHYESRHIPSKTPLPFQSVNLLRTGSNKFGIVQGRTLDCCTGDIALIYREHQSAALAIIRQMAVHDLTGEIHALLEFIPGTCSIFAFTDASGVRRHALVINAETDDPEVFLPPDKYSIDSNIVLNVGITLHLNACVEYNSSFVRFKINISEESLNEK
ncbi:MAG: hypothetical protein ACXV7J_10490 [Methylomonas sp.]